MKEDLELFFERLLTDQEFREKFIETKSAEEGYEMAKEYIPGVSLKEFKEGLTDLHDRFANRSYKELSDDSLSSVSGGKGQAYIDVLNHISTIIKN